MQSSTNTNVAKYWHRMATSVTPSSSSSASVKMASQTRQFAGSVVSSRSSRPSLAEQYSGLLPPAVREGASQAEMARLTRPKNGNGPLFDASGHKVVSLKSERRQLEKHVKVSPDMRIFLGANELGKPVTSEAKYNLWFKQTQMTYAPKFLEELRPRYNYAGRALKKEELPAPRLPEIAITGKSNCGKSTLMNRISGRQCCPTKVKPGSTQQLVFWDVGKPSRLRLVDCPGYGFAVANEETRVQWTEFMLWYLKSRATLKLVCILVDSKVGLQKSDREFLAFLERYKIRWQMLLTKCDRVKVKDLAKKITMVRKYDLDIIGHKTRAEMDQIHTVDPDQFDFHRDGEKSASYKYMLGPPIPISAKKDQNLDSVRKVMERFAMNRTMVVDGQRQKCYDLIELQRMRKKDKADRRQARLKEKEVERKQTLELKNVNNTLARWGLKEEDITGKEDMMDGEMKKEMSPEEQEMMIKQMSPEEKELLAREGELMTEKETPRRGRKSVVKRAIKAEKIAEIEKGEAEKQELNEFARQQSQQMMFSYDEKVLGVKDKPRLEDHQDMEHMEALHRMEDHPGKEKMRDANPHQHGREYVVALEDSPEEFDHQNRKPANPFFMEGMESAETRSENMEGENHFGAAGINQHSMEDMDLSRGQQPIPDDPLAGLSGVMSFDVTDFGSYEPDFQRKKGKKKRKFDKKSMDQNAAASGGLLPDLDALADEDAVHGDLVDKEDGLRTSPNLSDKDRIHAPKPTLERVNKKKIPDSQEVSELEDGSIVVEKRGDHIKEDDETLSKEDVAIGFRRGKKAHFKDDGNLHFQLKNRFKMEWRTKLEPVGGTELERNALELQTTLKEKITKGISVRDSIEGGGFTRNHIGEIVPAVVRPDEKRRPDKLVQISDRIGVGSLDFGLPIPKGTSKFRYVGRPANHIPKLAKPRDVARALGIDPKKTAMSGNSMTYAEAKKKWDVWAKRNKRNPRLVAEAGSPRAQDLKADFERRHGYDPRNAPGVDKSTDKRADPYLNNEVKRGKIAMQRRDARTKARIEDEKMRNVV